MKFERLFSPWKVKNLELKNRIIMPALHHLYTPDGYATDRFNQYYWRRAEGGPALIFVGGCRFDKYGGAFSMMSLAEDKFIDGYRGFTEGMHRRDCLVGVQLYHAGAYTPSAAIPGGGPAIAPSAGFSKFTKEQVREITKDEIQEVIQNWAAAAVRAQQAGFDIVEILGSAGYLICQFLSPLKNHRTDEYGGNWENRTRFAREVVHAVRKAVGPDYPLCMRIAGNDFVPGSNTNENAVEFCKLMESCGIDMFNVTGGWHESVVPQITGDLPRGGFSYLAAAVHDAVTVPVAVSNRINDPVVAERLLAVEAGDLVSIGRAMIADPDWPRKAQEGRSDEIRHCVACNQGCLSKTFFGRPIECLVNGDAGYEFERTHTPCKRPQRILVVGAGPAGCEFALRAAQRGHQVTVWEKSSQLGGQLQMVSVPPGKQEFSTLPTYYEVMLQKSGVTLVRNKTASAEEVRSAGFDKVVVATGMVPKRIKLPGDGSVPVTTAYDILLKKVMAGRRVLVVGGGSVGCETAQYLAHEGGASAEQVYFLLANQAERLEKVAALTNSTRREITIVDVASIGSGFDPGTGWPVMKDLQRLGVKRFSETAITDIRNGVVILSPAHGGDQIELICDTIVLAVGGRPNNDLAEALTDASIEVHLLGDAQQVGKIIDAIREAAELAEHI